MMTLDEALQCADDSEMNTGPERILAAEVRRLREEIQQQLLSPWQPIATAPKDKRILLYRPTTAGWWQVMGGKYDSDEYTKNPKPYWSADNWSLGKMEQRQHTPTHWMPLPEPAP